MDIHALSGSTAIELTNERAMHNARPSAHERRFGIVVAFIGALHVGLISTLVLAPSEPLQPLRIQPVRTLTVTLIAPPATSVARMPRETNTIEERRGEIAQPPRAVAHRPARRSPPPPPPVPSQPQRVATLTGSNRALQPHSLDHQDTVPTSTSPARDAPSTSPFAAPLSAATPAMTTVAAVGHPDCAMVKPPYPPMSKRLQEAGTAIVQLIIDERGTIESARVVRSSGYQRLDDAARDAVLASTCSPHIVDGTAKRVTAAVPFTFGFTN
ncbi:Protein tonB, putative [Ricinus communis]|uniref:Protein tonB, putative n=2 Tax=cellular organisms TaxID=131567 RepID=B9T8S2_RICCO|nr:Protein tonB, putative [Ricinus communis]